MSYGNMGNAAQVYRNPPFSDMVSYLYTCLTNINFTNQSRTRLIVSGNLILHYDPIRWQMSFESSYKINYLLRTYLLHDVYFLSQFLARQLVRHIIYA